MKKLILFVFLFVLLTRVNAQTLISSEEITLTNQPEQIKQIALYNILYQSDKDSVCGFLIKPKLITEKLPCIIYNRGGNRNFSRIDEQKNINMLESIAASGYVVLASNYRGSKGSTGKDEYGGDDIKDVLSLIKLTTSFKEIDTSKIGMLGQSRGGMMTYICLSKTTQIKAAISIAGVSDLIQLKHDRPEMELLYQELIPNYNTSNDSTLISRSAVFWSDKFDKNCKILLIHGANDNRVKASQSEKLNQLLKNQNIDSELVILNDDHKFTKHQKHLSDLIINWFDKKLSLQNK